MSKKRQRDLGIAEKLVQIRNSRMNGAKTYTIDELDTFLRDAVKKRRKDGRNVSGEGFNPKKEVRRKIGK